MTWRQFYLANKAMVLTLPAAALWSLPVGVIGLEWLQNSFPEIAVIFPFIPNPLYVVCILTPLATVCSFMAMELFSQSPKNPGISTLMMFFNLFTVVFTSLGTVAILFHLVGRFLDWLSR